MNSSISLVALAGFLLILMSGASNVEGGNVAPEMDPALCDYDHISDLKSASVQDSEKRLVFSRHFDQCIPIYGQWATEAVERMDPKQKEIILEFHQRQRDPAMEMEENLAIMLSQLAGEKKCKELRCDRQKFYQQIFLPSLDRMCSGFEGTLNELSRIYDILTGPWNEDEGVDEKLSKLKVFHTNSVDVTFEWVVYARTCLLLKIQRKFLSEGVRGLMLAQKSKPTWADNILHLTSKQRNNCQDPLDSDFDSMKD